MSPEEQNFSGLFRYLDFIVINIGLMLGCTSRASFYLSLMWKLDWVDVILSSDNTPPPCFADTPHWAHKTSIFFLVGVGPLLIRVRVKFNVFIYILAPFAAKPRLPKSHKENLKHRHKFFQVHLHCQISSICTQPGFPPCISPQPEAAAADSW